MKVGIPTEVKNNEFRVAATPAGVNALVDHGHEVLVQQGAGVGSAISDEEYAAVGAKIVSSADEVWDSSEMILKVKEPIASEFGFLRGDLTLFTYLHLAADRPLTEALLSAGTTAIAYETVRVGRTLPLLRPMMIFVVITSTIGGLQIFDEPRMYDQYGTGGANSQWLTITLWLYNIGWGEWNFGRAAALAWILFLIIFLWTPPHFWALAMYRREDYARSGLPMLPITHGMAYTGQQVWLYSLALEKQWSRHWSSTLSVVRYCFDSTVDTAGFEQNVIYLGVAYRNR